MGKVAISSALRWQRAPRIVAERQRFHKGNDQAPRVRSFAHLRPVVANVFLPIRIARRFRMQSHKDHGLIVGKLL